MAIGVFEQIAVVLAVCVAAGAVAVLLRQPVLLGLIAAGIAVGPAALGIVQPTAEIELLASVGTSLLLFVIGLKLDVRLVRRFGSVTIATGLGQVAFTAVLGYAIARGLLGLPAVHALYVAVALTFSSTIVVVTLLTDKRELNHLHGRVALGLLIVQDLLVVVAMLVIAAVDAVSDVTGPVAAVTEIASVLARGAVLIGVLVLIGRAVAPRLSGMFERQSELLVLTVVTWAILVAAGSIQLGFSAEVGAFLAGVSLASTPYRDAVAGRLTTLRDFLLVFFFVELGSRADLAVTIDQLGEVVVLSLFVLIGNPLVVMTIMGSLGYRRRVSFKTGLSVAQVSEFSLILVALGLLQGHIDEEVVSLVTVVGVVTIAVSTQLIQRSEELYRRLARPLRVFERRRLAPILDTRDASSRPEYVVIGVGRLGSTVMEELLGQGDRVLGVDFDPRDIQRVHGQLPVIYGDADDPDLPAQLPLAETRWIIITVRDLPGSLTMLEALRSHGYDGAIAVAADDPAICQELRDAGADLTIRPLHLAAAPLIRAIHRHRHGAPGGGP